MGLFGKKAEPVVEEPVVVVEEKKPEVIQVGKTVIGEGVTMVGDFDSKEEIVINGVVEGNITSTTNVSISETGKLQGNAKAENLYVDGSIEGDLEVKDLTKLSDTAIVTGTLATAKFITTEGSTFDGQLTMKTTKTHQVEEVDEDEE